MEKGLVVTDRDTVPIPLGNLTLTFGGSVRVPGKVEFVHPVHNFSVISYDPRLLGDTPVEEASFRSTTLEPGDTLWQVGTDHAGIATQMVVERRLAAPERTAAEALRRAGLGGTALDRVLRPERGRRNLPKLLAAESATPFQNARAKSVIFLMMEGGPSHLDTFDPKSKLKELHLKAFQRGGKEKSAMESGKREGDVRVG